MREMVTDAFVLGTEAFSENDLKVDLLTKDFGKIRAVVRTGRKLGSRLSVHLDVLSMSRVRIVNKKRFLVVDAVTLSRFEKIRADNKTFGSALDCLCILRNLVPVLLPDRELWYHVLSSFSEQSLNVPAILTFLGYNPELSQCCGCGNLPEAFFVTDQNFLCLSCSGFVPEKEIVYL